jgi:hypothetical protein
MRQNQISIFSITSLAAAFTAVNGIPLLPDSHLRDGN